MIHVVLIVRASGVLLFLIKGFNLNKIRTDVGLFLTVCNGALGKRCCSCLGWLLLFMHVSVSYGCCWCWFSW